MAHPNIYIYIYNTIYPLYRYNDNKTSRATSMRLTPAPFGGERVWRIELPTVADMRLTKHSL